MPTTSAAASSADLPGHDIEDVTLGNITIYYKGGGTKEMAKRQVEEYEKDYPEPQDFGTMPSYGFFFRHVSDLKVHDVETHFLSEEQRPPFVLDDVEDAWFHHVIGQKAPETPAFLFNNVKPSPCSSAQARKTPSSVPRESRNCR